MGLVRGVCCVVALVCAAVSAHAQWKWKDQAGQVHLSDLPPPRDIPDANVLQRPPPVPSRVAPAASAASGVAIVAQDKRRVDPELEARRNRAEQEQKAKSKADDDRLAEQRMQNCQNARQHLAGLESGQRMARTNERGERVVLDDRARAEEAQRARQVVESDCR